MKLRSAAIILALFCQLAFSWTGEPVRYEAIPDTVFTVDLKKELSLKGPFLLLAGPTWLSVNSAGILTGTPTKSDEGTNEFEWEVKSGNQWLQFSVVIEVGYPVRLLKIFVAPWCSQCLRMLEELDPVLNAKDYPRLEVKVYVETGTDPYKAPTTQEVAKLKSELKSNFDFVADKWQWEEFKKYYKGAFQVPGAVLMGAQDKILRVFPLGVTSEEILKSVVVSTPSTSADNAILWVVDNSGSMQPHQLALVKAMGKFFDEINSLKWKMAAVSTDFESAKGKGVQPPQFLWWNMPNLAVDFSNLVLDFGIDGSAYEKSFNSVLGRLKERPEFLRGVEKLNVIFFSDEREQSDIGAGAYLTEIRSLVPEVRHFGVFAASDMGCAIVGGSADAWYYKGSAYDAVIRAGVGGVASICSKTLESDLGALGKIIAGSEEY